MSLISPLLLRQLQFYLSGPLPCPYLPGQVQRKIFTRLAGNGAAPEHINAELVRAGFRRSHDSVYRPACAACAACVPVRIAVAQFAPSRTQRKLLRRAAAWPQLLSSAPATPAHFALFRHYQQQRHADSEMAGMNENDFAEMVADYHTSSQLFDIYDDAQQLQASMLVDALPDGFSAVYSFYNPDQAPVSLGTLLILRLLEVARQQGLPYIYLGYWISGCRKMNYKAAFAGLQKLTDAGWQPG